MLLRCHLRIRMAKSCRNYWQFWLINQKQFGPYVRVQRWSLTSKIFKLTNYFQKFSVNILISTVPMLKNIVIVSGIINCILFSLVCHFTKQTFSYMSMAMQLTIKIRILCPFTFSVFLWQSIWLEGIFRLC